MMLLITAAAEAGGGFDPLSPSGLGGFLWTFIVFAVALPFIWIVVMGPVTRALLARDEKAAEAIVSAQRASEDAQKARAEVEVALGQARAEAAQLLSEARARAESREREIVEGAKKEAEALVERARVEIQGEQEKALAAIRDEVVELSLGAASRVLGRAVKSEDDRRLARQLVGAEEGAKG
jgi:F-type H+-transporting ATPase subunit b